jgi:Uma2 family endonuclease
VDDESDVSDVGHSAPSMSATAPIEHPGMTAEELFELPDDGLRHELVEGELRTTTPAGFEHGRVAARILARVLDHADEHELGSVLAAETGFVLGRDPDTVRAPDVPFVAADRLPTQPEPGFGRIVPDLVVEVVSPWDRASEVSSTAAMWLDAGVRLVWVVDPQARLASVHHPGGQVTVLREDGVLEGEGVLPGFRLPSATLFR